MDGIRFVAAPNVSDYLEALVIDVLNYWGRDNLVAHHPNVQTC